MQLDTAFEALLLAGATCRLNASHQDALQVGCKLLPVLPLARQCDNVLRDAVILNSGVKDLLDLWRNAVVDVVSCTWHGTIIKLSIAKMDPARVPAAPHRAVDG